MLTTPRRLRVLALRVQEESRKEKLKPRGWMYLRDITNIAADGDIIVIDHPARCVPPPQPASAPPLRDAPLPSPCLPPARCSKLSL